MKTNEEVILAFSQSTEHSRPRFVASNCEAWAARLMLCGGRAYADIVGFSRDLLGYRCAPQSIERGVTGLRFYDFTFLENWIIVSPEQLAFAPRLVQPWWGIASVSCEGDCDIVRNAEESPQRKSIAIAELLWTSEVQELLQTCCDTKPLTGRRRMREQIAEALSPEQLGPLVSLTMRARPLWRAKAA